MDRVNVRKLASEFNELVKKRIFFIPKTFSIEDHGLFTFILSANGNYKKHDMLVIKDLSWFDKGFKKLFNNKLTREDIADPNIRAALHKIAEAVVLEINVIYDNSTVNLKNRFAHMSYVDTIAHRRTQYFLHYFYRDLTTLMKISITSAVNKVSITNIWPVFKEDVDRELINCFMKYNESEDKYSFISNDIIIDYIGAREPISWLFLADDMLLEDKTFLNVMIDEEINKVVGKIVEFERSNEITNVIKKQPFDRIIAVINEKIVNYKSGRQMDIELCKLYKRLLGIMKYTETAKTDHYLLCFLNILYSVYIDPITERSIVYKDFYTNYLAEIDRYIKANCRNANKIKTPNKNSSVKIFNHLMERHQIMVKSRKTKEREYGDLLDAIYKIMEFPECDFYFKLLLTALNTNRTRYGLNNMTIVPEDIIIMMVDMYENNEDNEGYKLFTREEKIYDPVKAEAFRLCTPPLSLDMFPDRETANYQTLNVAQVIVGFGYKIKVVNEKTNEITIRPMTVEDLEQYNRFFGTIKKYSTRIFITFNNNLYVDNYLTAEEIGEALRPYTNYLEVSFTFEGEKIIIYHKDRDMLYDVRNEEDNDKRDDIHDKLFYHVLTGGTVDIKHKFKTTKDLINGLKTENEKVVYKLIEMSSRGIPVIVERLECRALLPNRTIKKDNEEYGDRENYYGIEEFTKTMISFYV